MKSKRSKLVFNSLYLVFTVIIFFVISNAINRKGEPPFPTISDQKIENGKYYFRGDLSQCYFLINNNTIQLVGTSEQLHKFHDYVSPQNDYDEWYNSDISELISTKDFIVVSNVNGDLNLVWHWTTDEKGNIISYTGLSYNTNGSIHYIDDFVIKKSS